MLYVGSLRLPCGDHYEFGRNGFVCALEGIDEVLVCLRLRGRRGLVVLHW